MAICEPERFGGALRGQGIAVDFRTKGGEMPQIQTTCPNATCGDVVLYPEEVTLHMHPDEDRSQYSFVCPSHGGFVVKPAFREVRLILIGALGVQIDWLPMDLAEVHDGPPITEADVERFANDIAHVDHLAAIARQR